MLNEDRKRNKKSYIKIFAYIIFTKDFRNKGQADSYAGQVSNNSKESAGPLARQDTGPVAPEYSISRVETDWKGVMGINSSIKTPYLDNPQNQKIFEKYGLNLLLCDDANKLQPITSDNPAVETFSLFKELTGFPNYGNPSRNADILYTGNQGEWTFELPKFFFMPGRLKAQLDIRAVLDDRAETPADRYSATISINNRVVHRGALPLAHGRPFAQPFDNWKTLTFDVPDIRRTNRVVIKNTSNGLKDDWIGLDWMELRLFPK